MPTEGKWMVRGKVGSAGKWLVSKATKWGVQQAAGSACCDGGTPCPNCSGATPQIIHAEFAGIQTVGCCTCGALSYGCHCDFDPNVSVDLHQGWPCHWQSDYFSVIVERYRNADCTGDLIDSADVQAVITLDVAAAPSNSTLWFGSSWGYQWFSRSFPYQCGALSGIGNGMTSPCGSQNFGYRGTVNLTIPTGPMAPMRLRQPTFAPSRVAAASADERRKLAICERCPNYYAGGGCTLILNSSNAVCVPEWVNRIRNGGECPERLW